MLLLLNDVMIVILPTRIQHTHTDLVCKFRLLRSPFRATAADVVTVAVMLVVVDRTRLQSSRHTPHCTISKTLLLHCGSRHTTCGNANLLPFAFFASSFFQSHSLTHRLWLPDYSKSSSNGFFLPKRKCLLSEKKHRFAVSGSFTDDDPSGASFSGLRLISALNLLLLVTIIRLAWTKQ